MKRKILLGAAALVLFLVGVGIGASGKAKTKTVTVARTNTINTTVTETVTHTKVVLRSPPSSGVKVSYGDYPDLFKIAGAHVVNQYGSHATVLGQFTYLGGGDCKPLTYVEVTATFYGKGGGVVGTGLWNSETAPAKVGLPMEVGGEAQSSVARAEIVVTAAHCK